MFDDFKTDVGKKTFHNHNSFSYLHKRILIEVFQ